MKELAVKNYKTAEGQKISQGGNEFTCLLYTSPSPRD